MNRFNRGNLVARKWGAIVVLRELAYKALGATAPMTPDEREQICRLCERISSETDHDKFLALLRELNELLEHKQQRIETPDTAA